MATVQISDVYDPLTFDEAMQEAQPEKNAFLRAGIITSDPKLEAHLATGGQIGELPFYYALGTSGAGGSGTEPNFSSDDPAQSSTPKNITSAKMVYRASYQNQSWSAMDLAREVTNMKDPLGAIVNRVAEYWAINTQNRIIKSAMGVLADNVANDSGDMLVTVATDDAGAVTSAEKISADLIIDARATMGDSVSSAQSLIAVMHSVVYAELQKQQLIEFIPNARGEVNIPTYLGHMVIVDDGMPAVAGTNRITYTTMLLGAGSFGYGMGSPSTPSEVDRDPASGEGGGQEILYSRTSEIIHPVGFSFSSTSLTGGNGNTQASYADLANAANWDRVFANRKNIQMAFVQSNG